MSGTRRRPLGLDRPGGARPRMSSGLMSRHISYQETVDASNFDSADEEEYIFQHLDKEANMVATKLKAASVERGGVTARYVTLETREVELDLNGNGKAVRFEFCLNSKGGGETQVYLNVGASDLSSILEKMAKVDRQATMAAMATELARQVGEQPSHDAKNETQGRYSVIFEAESEHFNAPKEKKDFENFVVQRVRRLVEKLEEEEEEEDAMLSRRAGDLR